MESKKISFGFSKVTKKPNLLPTKVPSSEQQVELIKCLEAKEIKLVEERKEVLPIVIPMKENGKTSSALASLMRRRAVLRGEDYEPAAIITTSTDHTQLDISNIDNVLKNDTEKRVVREIIAELEEDKNTADAGLVLPILKPDELPLDGAAESKMEDYEAIPIEQYGLAMLRGMGWKEPSPTQQNKQQMDDKPTVRPKGMGLGADKALKTKPLLVQPEKNEILEIKKQACVRILAGKHKDAYGQIEGFDDMAGRVIVKMAIGGAKEAFNEFLCQPVSKKEFAQYGKCINSSKYEEYKRQVNECGGHINLKKEEKTIEIDLKGEDEKEKIKTENNKQNENKSLKQWHEDYPADNKHRSRSRSRSRSGKKRYSDNDDNSSEIDTDSAYERKHHKKSSKSKSHKKKSKKSSKESKRRDCSSESRHHPISSNSDNESDNETRQRDHHKSKKNKKKTKKSKKNRSRTPSRHRR